MNRTIFILTALLSALFMSCEEPDPAFIEPNAAFSTDQDMYEVFQPMRVSNEGEGQFYAVFTGDADHEFSNRENGDTGFKTDVNGNFSYSYSQAGTYTITYVASGYRFVEGERIEAIAQKQITVTDPAIEEVSIVSFEVGNSSINNNKFLDPISFLFKDFRNTADTIDNPNRKVAFSYYRPSRLGEIANGSYNQFKTPADINIVPNLRLSTASRTVTVQIEGVTEFETGQTRIIHDTEGDLRFVPKTYSLVNNEGARADYTVCPMIIPEMVTFEAGGTTGTVSLSAGDYNEFFVVVDVPDGTDLSSLSPAWTLFDPANTKVYVNGDQQTSAVSTQDFSDGVVTYLVEYTQPKSSSDTYVGEFHSRAIFHVTIE